MIKSISYKENPEYYKRLISKINEEVDFASHLIHLGYRLFKKSAGSIEFIDDKDRIVLITSRSPVSYFNRNDSEDKGLFFKFLRKRKHNFYETIKLGLEIINRSYDLDIETKKIPKKSLKRKSLEENYNIVSLSNPVYLTKERAIDIKTIHSDFFKGRIFNAFHFSDNGGKIANVAFPKFNVNGKPQNYIIYNKPYKERNTGKLKKFRLVLNKKDHYLFHSNLPERGTKRIVFGESGIDLLSFNELNGKEGDFYISFGGNIYKEKLDFFYQLIAPIISQNNIELVSILDNDIAGFEYDIKVFTKVINELSFGIYFENSFKQGDITIKIHYNQNMRMHLASDSKFIEKVLRSNLPNNTNDYMKNVVFSDKLILEFSIPELMKLEDNSLKNTNALQQLILALNELYLPIPANILKSKGKDWNEDLKNSKKKSNYQKMDKIDPNQIQKGDKIILKTIYGPEDSVNNGIVERVSAKGILTNFGLTHSYMIPFNAIKTHLKLVHTKSDKITGLNQKVNSKNQIKL